MRISDWSSDVCSSDLGLHWFIKSRAAQIRGVSTLVTILKSSGMLDSFDEAYLGAATVNQVLATSISSEASTEAVGQNLAPAVTNSVARSEEHTSELQSLMRISYAVFCLKKTTHDNTHQVHCYTHL